VIREESGRSVIHCDRCPVRMDLGPTAVVTNHLRMPSAWMQDAPDHHLCPACTQRAMKELADAQR
jgi:hypothetical protein